MKKAIILAMGLTPVTALCSTVNFTGSQKEVITVKPQASTGLDDIYVIYDADGVSASYTATSQTVKWYRYSSLGGGYAEEIPGIVRNGTTYTLYTSGTPRRHGLHNRGRNGTPIFLGR